VLIHAAAGGVGLAAVRLAQVAGAEVFATAGSTAKREFLQACGVLRVFDSRSLKFADQIREIAGPRGVDVVLNSLAGDAIDRSLELLGSGGRFLEIGRRDIYMNRRLPLRPFANNLAYFAVDLGQLLQPDRIQTVASAVRLLQSGQVQPLPYRAFPLTEAAAAFAHMSQGRQIGKIVLCPRAAPLVVSGKQGPARLEFDREATYLITGGIDGFGAVVAKSLTLKGARHLVLMARRGRDTPGAPALLAELRQAGAQPVIMRGDVSRPADLARVLRQIRRRLPPLRGIIHSAGLIDDGLLRDLNVPRFQAVMAPKVAGAWLLHELTLGQRLDFFVLFSSAASVLGSAGQGNYAAANAFMDSLAHYRRALGLPAVAINWGMLNDVGFVARSPRLQKLFLQLGWTGFTSRQAVQLLAQIIPAAPVQITAAKIDWAAMAERLAPWPRYASLFSGGLAAPASGDRAAGWMLEQLTDCPPAQAQALLEQFLMAEVARALPAAPAEISATKPLTELGLDSLMIVELVTRIERQLGAPIPSGKLVGSSTIARLAEAMLQVLKPAAVPAPPEAAAPTPSLAWVADADLDPQLRFDAPLIGAERIAKPRRVLLTACADFLSVFLLRDLLASTTANVCCLAAVADVEALRRGLTAEFKRLGLSGDLSRVELVPGRLDVPRFGLADAEFMALAASVDAIYHSGALVNHVSSYSRLKAANVDAVGVVLQLATRTSRKPVHHVSSFSLLTAGKGAAPVAEDDPLAHPERLHGGYPQTRWAAEKMLRAAGARGVPVTIFRPGLLVGPVASGEPGPEHFVWSILKQCLQLGCGPNVDVPTLLTPVDFVSQGIVRLAREPDAAGQAFHLINPRGGTVAELVLAAREFGYKIRLAKPAEWESRLVAHARGAQANRVLPYYLLRSRAGRSHLNFEDHLEIDSRATLARLRALGTECPALDANILHRYLGAMVTSGFIPPPQTLRPENPVAATAAGGCV
jgi:thioester reductase-like protein